jgi:hypothetical protein
MMEMWMLDGRHYRRLSRLRVAIAVMGGIGLATAGIGAAASTSAASTQANAETNATNQANQIQEQEFNQTQANQAPYLAAGTQALGTIQSDQANQTGFATPWDPSQLASTPGYQFTLDQGNQAIQRSAAAQGGLLSGAAAKAMDQYTTGLASQTYNQQYQNYLSGSNQSFNQLASVAGLGQSATQSLGNTGAATAASIGGNTIAGATGAANATASGIVGSSNALSSAGGSLGNYYMLNQAGLLGGSPTYANSPAYYPGAQANPYTNQVDQENEMSSLGAAY